MLGEQVSHYRLTAELGSGTYGVVYRGVHVHDAELFAAVDGGRSPLGTGPGGGAAPRRGGPGRDGARHPERRW